MKFIFKSLVYFVFFVICIFVFLPKVSLYYLLEKELAKNKIVISNEVINDKTFSFSVNGADVYFEGINVALIKSLNIKTYLVYTDISVNKIRVLESLKNMIPSPIEKLDIKHSVLDITKIKIYSKGSFGVVDGFVDLIERKVILKLKATNNMKQNYYQVLNQMILKDGRYVYEYKF